MTRQITAFASILGLAALLAFDVTYAPPNPYAAPAALALGSGQAASGGFCAALPTQ